VPAGAAGPDPAGHHAARFDGLDICKGIRKDPDLAATPIIFLTAGPPKRTASWAWRSRQRLRGEAVFVRELVARIKLQFATRPRRRACWKPAAWNWTPAAARFD